MGSGARNAPRKQVREAIAKSGELSVPPLPPLPLLAMPSQSDGHLHVGSDSVMQALREALAMNTFREVEDSPWPTAQLNRGGSHGHVQLRPLALDQQPIMPPAEIEAWKESMWKQREELTDLDVDTLDAMNAIWLCQAQNEAHGAIANVDAILKLRGVRTKKGGKATRGGYEPEQRLETLKTISHLQNVWLTMALLPAYEQKGRRKKGDRVLQSRAFVITDRAGQLRLDGFMDVDSFMFRPGDVLARVLFGPGRQTALMSAMALRYNPYKQTWEKRLTRYLSWQWRCRARNDNYMQPFKITTLLEAVGEALDQRRPIRTRERLEKALDTILQDRVISAWQYERWDEDNGTGKGWAATWLQTTILIEPPEVIRDQYKKLEGVDTKQRKALPGDAGLGERVEEKRRALGLSQMQAAELMGITQAYWSFIASGKKQPDTILRWKLQEWLASEG